MIPIDNITGRLGNKMFQFAYIINQFHLGLIKDCYVQDEAYFVEAADKVKSLFRQGIGEKIDAVAIHVRRGDYIGNDFYIDLTKTDYYKKAIDLFPDSRFMVFSDDIEWCERNFVKFSGHFSFAQGKSEVEDMNLMAACKGHIIANSSFSWWGAYLSPFSEKIVAPSVENWHPDGVERTVCPNNWIRI